MNLLVGRSSVRAYTFFAIALHESAGFTSSLWNRANNAVGMRPPSWSRRWYAEDNGYAAYKNGFLCGLDFMQWMERAGCMRYGNGMLWALTLRMKEKGYYEADHEPYYANSLSYYERWKTKISMLNGLAWVIMAIIPSVLLIVLLMPKGAIKNKFKKWTSKKSWKL